MKHHTKMPPSLSEPWDFGGWDNRLTHTPPWQHRGFWYHGAGIGPCVGHDKLVVLWQHSFDDGGRWTVSGDIYRCADGLKAIFLWRDLRERVKKGNYDGVFIFFGTRRMSEVAVYGEPFPLPLPDGRWRV